MKDKIPEFLKSEFKKYRSNTNNFPLQIKQFLVEYSNFYNWGFEDDLKKIFAVMKKGISELPVCGLDGCSKKVYFKHYLKLTEGCCLEHSQQITFLKKYGETNPMKDSIVKKKVQNSMKQKYGVEHPMQSIEIMNKTKITMKEKYGVEHPMKSDFIKNKQRDTIKKKFGVDNIFQDVDTKKQIKKWREEHIDEISNKVKQTMLKRYGVETPLESDIIVNKMKSTMKEKYGVEHNMQSPELYKKNIKAMYKKKEYIWKNGEVSLVQGYEPMVLIELEEKGYTFNDIITDESDMPEIWYEFEGKKRRYYPDIYIPSENLIIEVKSDWTLNLHKDKNNAKFNAVKSMGYDFKLECR